MINIVLPVYCVLFNKSVLCDIKYIIKVLRISLKYNTIRVIMYYRNHIKYLYNETYWIKSISNLQILNLYKNGDLCPNTCQRQPNILYRKTLITFYGLSLGKGLADRRRENQWHLYWLCTDELNDLKKYYYIKTNSLKHTK